jgi:LysR family transcriptional regulator, cyn operon transcriptional activator
MILRYIHYFLAVAEHGSFTKAAAALFVSQPALSQQIKLLEQSLDASLFDRSGRQVHLTDAGQVFAQHARQALSALEAGSRAVHDVQDLTRGHLRLGVTPTYTPWLIGPLLSAFWQRYPGITVAVSEAPQGQIEQQLIADALDVGLGFSDGADPELLSRTLMPESLAVVVNRDHPLAAESQISLEALSTQPLVLLDTGFATRTEIDRQCRERGLSLSIVMQTNTLGAITEVVQRAPLATLLPDTVARAHPSLCTLRVAPPLSQRTGVLLMRKNSQHAAASALAEVLESVLQALKA